MLRVGVGPEFFAIANKVFFSTFNAGALGHALIVVSVELKIERTASTFRLPILIDGIRIFRVRGEELANVGRFAANPPSPSGVYAHATSSAG